MPKNPTNNKDTLTNRALFTFATQLLAQIAGLISGLIFTPIIVHGLGLDLYGAWNMVGKSTGYMGITNLNAMSSLKLALGTRQHSNDIGEKRRLIGAAIVQWLVLLPLALLATGTFVWLAPRLIKISPLFANDLRIAMGIMALAAPISLLFSIPSVVLRSHNLAYKGFGWNAVTILAGGALGAWAITMGTGLIGLSIASLLGITLNLGIYLFIVRKNLPWFGIEKPQRSELFSFGKLSGWMMAHSMIGIIWSTVDTLLIGYLLGIKYAGLYATTSALLRFSVAPVKQLLGSGNAGIAYLVARQEWKRLSQLRMLIHQSGLLFLTVIGGVVLLLNESFVSLWLGEGYSAGSTLIFAMVICEFVRRLMDTDAIPLDAMLKIKQKVKAMTLWTCIGIGIGISLIKILGMIALPIGMTICYLGCLCNFQIYLKCYSKLDPKMWFQMVRPALVAAVFVVFAFYASKRDLIYVDSWLTIVLLSCFVAVAIFSLYLAVGIPKSTRRSLINRIMPKKNFGGHK